MQHCQVVTFGIVKQDTKTISTSYTLNHALKISVHSGQLPYTTEAIFHKIHSFMRRLQHHPSSFTPHFPTFYC